MESTTHNGEVVALGPAKNEKDPMSSVRERERMNKGLLRKIQKKKKTKLGTSTKSPDPSRVQKLVVEEETRVVPPLVKDHLLATMLRRRYSNKRSFLKSGRKMSEMNKTRKTQKKRKECIPS